MALNESKKSCIAWFKLAEFVERKEKEKALALYNLLSKSLNNEAFGQSLLGTIHKYFNDLDEATKKLSLSLDLYQDLNLEVTITIREFLIIHSETISKEQIQALAKDYIK